MNKKTLMALGAIFLIGAGVVGSGQVFAQDSNSDNPMSSLVQKIADKFGLNKDDVQAVFDEQKTEMHAKMQAKEKARLSQLVTDGKITDAQKALIIAKRKELESNREANKDAFKNLTQEERKTKIDDARNALETWAKDNNIDIKYLMGPFGHGFKMGMRAGMGVDN